MEKRFFRYGRPFELESGKILPGFTLCYHISKDYKGHADGRKVIWITHALTANSNPQQWWNTLVGEDKFFSPRKHIIVCANILGSCYGSTGPASANPETGRAYLNEFPKITVRDVVKAMDILRTAIGIGHIDLITGGSVGGFQALEWAIMAPKAILNVALIACDYHATPWVCAFNAAQRMALEADGSYLAPATTEDGKKGLAAARAIALLSYRSFEGYDKTQQDAEDNLWQHRAHSYQRYQGEKLASRFNAFSYSSMIDVVDSHNVGRGRGGAADALAGIKAHTLCIGITSDYLFPAEKVKKMASMIPQAEYRSMDSVFGHDGFLLEHSQLEQVIYESFKEVLK